MNRWAVLGVLVVAAALIITLILAAALTEPTAGDPP